MGEVLYSGETCYELTLTPDYVSEWTFNDAIRELIQNGTDQEALDRENHFEVGYDRERQVLQLKNTRSVLKVNTLLLGRGSKARNEDTVGRFGEGYKIAALVLNRLGKTFTVLNNGRKEIWRSGFKNSEKWNDKILAFYVSKRKTEDSGLCIEVGNVSRSEYMDMSEVWIKMCGFDYGRVGTQYGEILTDEEFAGRVFVNGLFVDCHSDLQYGYNFKPKYIELERDRKTCDTWNVEEVTSKMVAEGMVNGGLPIEVVRRMVESGKDDVYHLKFHTYLGDVKKVQKMLVESFDQQNPKPFSIPVSSQEEVAKVKAYGGNPVVVPAQVAELLREEAGRRFEELVELPCGSGMTLRERFLRWYGAYSERLPEAAKKEMKLLIEELE